MFTLSHIPQISTVTHQWLPLRGSTITLPHPRVTPLPRGCLRAVAVTCLALCNLSEFPKMSLLSRDKAYCFRVLPLSCTGQSSWRRAPWGRQTARGHLDFERCMWMKDLDFPCLLESHLTKRLPHQWCVFPLHWWKALRWPHQLLIHFVICLLLPQRNCARLQLAFPFWTGTGGEYVARLW